MMTATTLKKDGQQGGERQSLLDALPSACSSGHAGERRREHDDRQADQPNCSQMEGKTRDKPGGNQPWTISLALSSGVRCASSSRS